MIIYIKTLIPKGNIKTLEVEPNDHIFAVKEKYIEIAQYKWIPGACFFLYQGKLFLDPYRLNDFNIGRENTLHLI